MVIFNNILVLDIVFFTLFICSLHVGYSSIMTHKHFIDWALVIIWLFIFKSTLKWQLLLSDLNIIKCVLPIFSDNVLIFNHSTNLRNSLFIETVILFRLSPSIKILVSSANNIGKILSNTLIVSLTYNRNRSGPKIDPRGTRHKPVLAAERLSLKETNCLRLVQIGICPCIYNKPNTIISSLFNK